MAQAVALAVSWAVGFDVGLSGGIGLVGYPIGGGGGRQTAPSCYGSRKWCLAAPLALALAFFSLFAGA